MTKKQRKKRKHIHYIPLIGIDQRFLKYLKPHAYQFAAIVGLIFALATIDIFAPWPLKFIIDNVINGEAWEGPIESVLRLMVGNTVHAQATRLGIAMLLVTFMQGVVRFGYEYLIGVVQEKAAHSMRLCMFDHIQHLSLPFFRSSRHGDLLKRVTEDTTKVMTALVGSIGEFLLNIVKFVGFALVMVLVDWRFSLIALAYVPLLFYIYIAFRNQIRSTAREARKQDGEIMNVTLETIGAIREVKAFGQEDYQLDQFRHFGKKRIRSALRSARWEASFSPVINVIQAMSTATVVWFGVALILRNDFSVGELVIFLAYMKDIYSPLRRFSRLLAQWQKAAASGDRLGKILDTNHRMKEVTAPLHLGIPFGSITFSNVSFAYPENPEQLILRNIDLSVESGETVAFVGQTGAGKSTIANLLLRFYDVTQGQLLLDGVDIRQMSLPELRAQFSIVPQEAVLFSTSIWNNIKYGVRGCTREAVVSAAKIANAHDFILEQPQAYSTELNERGTTLSGGQRQRIAIARAILRDTPFLILDEPTAALDAGSEFVVMEALDRLMKGRTTFIITHRLSTIKHADKIVVMANGQIIECGTHSQLMQTNGQYSNMVRLQQGQAFERAVFAT